MNKHFLSLVAAVIGLLLVSTRAQFGPPSGGLGGPPPGPRLTGSMAKLFGNNTAFAASLEMQTKDKSGATNIMPGKIAAAAGQSRFETDLTQAKGAGMGPKAASQLKAVGMDRMVNVTRPDKKVVYSIYPGMQAYVEMPLQDPDATKPESEFKVETVELGKETVDEHPCVKNQVVVTDKEGTKHESTVWNASDLQDFPIKIVTNERGTNTTLLFKDVKLAPPEASLFDPPAGFKRYDSMMGMMQETMMKQMSR